MKTPTRNEIEEKARELWHSEQAKKGNPIFDIEPERHELRESGFLSLAQSHLMRDGARSQNEIWGSYSDHVEFYDNIPICESGKFSIPFNVEEQQDSNTLVCGANKTGKSLLSCGITSILQNLNWKIVAFDPVGNYKTISDIPTYYNVTKTNYDREEKKWFYPYPEDSIIFDMSLLKPIQQKSFVDTVLEQLWDTQVKNSSRRTLVILEEFQLYGRTVRGSASQNILRIMSAGRNHKIRVLAVTVDLALIDTAFIRLTSQRFYGRINVEENSKRKFKNYHGGDWLRICQELDLGYFVYMLRDKLKVVKVQCFETKRLSMPLETKRVYAK